MDVRHLGFVLLVGMVIAAFIGWMFVWSDPETNGEAQLLDQTAPKVTTP